MRIPALVLFVLMLSIPLCAQKTEYPTDGNGVLDYCTHVVTALDSPGLETSGGEPVVLDNMMKFSWCVGYIEGIRDMLTNTQIHMFIAAQAGVKFSGPAPMQQYLLDGLTVACLPEKASPGQLARVLVKWLRDNPNRLHEPKITLTLVALKDAFPCQGTAAASSISK